MNHLTNAVVICLQISIFELLNTTNAVTAARTLRLWFAYKLVSLNYWIQRQAYNGDTGLLWFAYKLVSLNYWIQLWTGVTFPSAVVICLQISIFELLNTTRIFILYIGILLWFAYKLVSLNYWIQHNGATR